MPGARKWLLVTATLVVGVVPLRAEAAGEVSGSVGTLTPYLDEPAEFAAGAAVRVRLFRRFSIRPELIAVHGREHTHWIVLGNAIFDFTDPDKRVVGYAVAGGGWEHTRYGRSAFGYTRGVGVGGAGVRVLLSDRWVASTEFRCGRSAYPLLTFSIGRQFGRR